MYLSPSTPFSRSASTPSSFQSENTQTGDTAKTSNIAESFFPDAFDPIGSPDFFDFAKTNPDIQEIPLGHATSSLQQEQIEPIQQYVQEHQFQQQHAQYAEQPQQLPLQPLHYTQNLHPHIQLPQALQNPQHQQYVQQHVQYAQQPQQLPLQPLHYTQNLHPNIQLPQALQNPQHQQYVQQHLLQQDAMKKDNGKTFIQENKHFNKESNNDKLTEETTSLKSSVSQLNSNEQQPNEQQPNEQHAQAPLYIPSLEELKLIFLEKPTYKQIDIFKKFNSWANNQTPKQYHSSCTRFNYRFKLLIQQDKENTLTKIGDVFKLTKDIIPVPPVSENSTNSVSRETQLPLHPLHYTQNLHPHIQLPQALQNPQHQQYVQQHQFQQQHAPYAQQPQQLPLQPLHYTQNFHPHIQLPQALQNPQHQQYVQQHLLQQQHTQYAQQPQQLPLQPLYNNQNHHPHIQLPQALQNPQHQQYVQQHLLQQDAQYTQQLPTALQNQQVQYAQEDQELQNPEEFVSTLLELHKQFLPSRINKATPEKLKDVGMLSNILKILKNFHNDISNRHISQETKLKQRLEIVQTLHRQESEEVASALLQLNKQFLVSEKFKNLEFIKKIEEFVQDFCYDIEQQYYQNQVRTPSLTALKLVFEPNSKYRSVDLFKMFNSWANNQACEKYKNASTKFATVIQSHMKKDNGKTFIQENKHFKLKESNNDKLTEETIPVKRSASQLDPNEQERNDRSSKKARQSNPLPPVSENSTNSVSRETQLPQHLQNNQQDQLQTQDPDLQHFFQQQEVHNPQNELFPQQHLQYMQQLHPDLQHLLPYAQQLHPYVQFQQQQYTQQQHQIQQQQFQQPLNIPKEDKSLQVHFLCEQNSEELNNQILLAFREKLTNKLSRGQEYTVVKLFETLYPEWRGLKSEKRKTFFDPFKIHLNLFMKLDEKKTITFYSHYSYRYYRLT